jgi:hypothetical protein
MRKRVLIVGVLLGVLVVVPLLGVYFARPSGPRPGITPDNVRAIEPGMSAAEVERLMGVPPGLHDPHITVEAAPDTKEAGKHWVGSRAAAYVCFDEEGRVTVCYPLVVTPMRKPGFVERVRRWLGL